MKFWSKENFIENLIIHHNQQRIQQARKRNVIDTHQIVRQSDAL
jgi:hypothetical protein